MKLIIALALVVAAATRVYAGPLPPLINFQSVLLDEGGNLLPSGPTTIQFQILDENHEAIYFENQTVDVVKGAVSALVGNGSDDQGITTGGIPEDIFATGAPRYLQVQVGSQVPEAPMTIVPVPYAQWSQTSASVADGAVSSAKIATAAVGFEHLAPDVVGKLATELSASHGILTTQSLASIGGATQVGVTAKFINSGSSTVQGVLQDIDLAVKKRQEEYNYLKNSVVNDINNIPGKLKLDHLEPNSAAVSDLNMGGYKITNLMSPTNAADAVSKSYVDASLADLALLFIKKDGTTYDVSADIPLKNHKITELAEPTALQDASTKKYVDDEITEAKTYADDNLTAAKKYTNDSIAGVDAKIDSVQTTTNAALDASALGTLKIAMGTYVGKGEGTQTISTPGIHPRIVFLHAATQDNDNSDFWELSNYLQAANKPVGGIYYNSSSGGRVLTGTIGVTGMTSGGFSVGGDGNLPVQFEYIALGEAI